MEFLLSFNLYVLNGTKFDSSGGMFTYLSAKHASTIDYIAVSMDLLPSILQFEVLETPFSDHNPLILSICCWNDLFLPPNVGVEIMVGHRKPKWSDQLQTVISQFLASDESVLCVRENLILGCKPISHYMKITNCLKPLFQHKKHQNPTPYRRSAWFDDECKECKKTVLSCLRTLRRDKDERSLAQLRRTKQKYKELLARKKKLHSQQFWIKLQEAVKDKNETLFWELISSESKDMALSSSSTIQATEWFDHYFKVFEGDKMAIVTLEPSELGECWPPVTEDEIKSLIRALPSNKSPGEDLIPSECYKAFSEWRRQSLLGSLHKLMIRANFLKDGHLAS